MGIIGRGNRRFEFERLLEDSAPIKKTLIRAQAYTCPDPKCFVNGRAGVNPYCPSCGGTGYNGLAAQPDNSYLLKPPAAKLYFLTAEIQVGHGIFSSGGDFTQLLGDLGRLQAGDASMFCRVNQVDRATGELFFPDVIGKKIRPDYIRDKDGMLWTVAKMQPINIGDSVIGRFVTLQAGAQGV